MFKKLHTYTWYTIIHPKHIYRKLHLNGKINIDVNED